ncbi:MAG: TIGR00282 family metallophosphoesterase [Christensenella sp.]
MKILVIGDVVGPCGRKFLEKHLWRLRKEFSADMTVVNGENMSSGNGILPCDADALFDAGADVITTGNHVFQRREIYDYLDDKKYIIRPANYPACCPGRGYCTYETAGASVAVINIMGNMYLEPLESPFDRIDAILEGTRADVVLVDFHAEATSEKKALGYYLDGRVAALFGTHTHVQTADERILPGGTGYITDLGMTGAYSSVLGIKTDIIIEKFRTCMPQRFFQEDADCEMCGIILDIDESCGKTREISRVALRG